MKLQLIFGITYQIPYSISDSQIKERFMSLLAPLIKRLYHSSHVHTTLHIPGHQLWWIEHRYPEYIAVLKEMIERKQIEMLGGGYYNPILPLIPRSDTIGQIEMGTTYIRRLFGKRSHGIWIYDQIWESTYPVIFHSCNMKYAFLKDTSILGESPTLEHSYNPVITESEGRSVVAFLTNSEISSLWQSGRPRKVINALKEIHTITSVPSPVVLFDHSDTMLPLSRYERFFTLLKSNSDWLETTLPLRIWQRAGQLKKRYFFSESTNLVRTSLVKYPERSSIYAKMHHVYILVNQIRGDKYRKKTAQESLWQSQNCYSYVGQDDDRASMPFIRKAYTYLIEAEHFARAQGAFNSSIQSVDFNFDGIDEYLFHGKYINAYLHQRGGSIFELDFFPTKWNWIDSNHQLDGQTTTSKYSNEQKPAFPPTTNAFIDYIMPTETTVHGLARFRAREPQVSHLLYHVQKVDREHSVISLAAQWYVGLPENIIDIIKVYYFELSSIRIDYQLVNRCNIPLRCSFASQVTLTPSVEGEDTSLRCWDVAGKVSQMSKKNAAGRIPNVVKIDVSSKSHKHQANIECSGSDELWYENSMRYNRHSLIPRWHLNLGPNDTRSLQISINITKMKRATNPKDD